MLPHQRDNDRLIQIDIHQEPRRTTEELHELTRQTHRHGDVPADVSVVVSHLD
jgi:hypothetical protein